MSYDCKPPSRQSNNGNTRIDICFKIYHNTFFLTTFVAFLSAKDVTVIPKESGRTTWPPTVLIHRQEGVSTNNKQGAAAMNSGRRQCVLRDLHVKRSSGCTTSLAKAIDWLKQFGMWHGIPGPEHPDNCIVRLIIGYEGGAQCRRAAVVLTSVQTWRQRMADLWCANIGLLCCCKNFFPL